MKNIILLIFYILLISCNHDSKNVNSRDCKTVISKENRITFNDEINRFISDFIQDRNNADCIYEFYIDKKTDDEYFLTLFSSPTDPDYFLYRFPVLYTEVDGHTVFVYSGVEDFIKKDNYSSELKIQPNTLDRLFIGKTVSMVINKDTSYIAGDIGIPFIDVRFTPPVIARDADLEEVK